MSNPQPPEVDAFYLTFKCGHTERWSHPAETIGPTAAFARRIAATKLCEDCQLSQEDKGPSAHALNQRIDELEKRLADLSDTVFQAAEYISQLQRRIEDLSNAIFQPGEY